MSKACQSPGGLAGVHAGRGAPDPLVVDFSRVEASRHGEVDVGPAVVVLHLDFIKPHQKDSRVGLVGHVELDVDFHVAEFFQRDQVLGSAGLAIDKDSLARLGHEEAVFLPGEVNRLGRTPLVGLGGVLGLPALQALAVHQRPPAIGRGGKRVECSGREKDQGEAEKEETESLAHFHECSGKQGEIGLSEPAHSTTKIPREQPQNGQNGRAKAIPCLNMDAQDAQDHQRGRARPEPCFVPFVLFVVEPFPPIAGQRELSREKPEAWKQFTAAPVSLWP